MRLRWHRTRKLPAWGSALAALLLAVAVAPDQEEEERLVLHLNKLHPEAVDTNPGAEDQPLRSFQAALDKAAAAIATGRDVTVRVHPGNYYEYLRLELPPPREEQGELEIVATEPRKAVLIGGVLARDWRKRADGVYFRDWKDEPPLVVVLDHRRILKPYGWHRRYDDPASLAGRDEEFFAYIEEDTGVELHVPRDISVTRFPVTATLPSDKPLLSLSGGRAVIFRGIVFRQSGHIHGVRARDFRDLIFRDCRFDWNVGYGLAADRGEVLSLYGSDFVSNYAGGWRISRVEEVELLETTSEFDGWMDRGERRALEGGNIVSQTELLLADALRITDGHGNGMSVRSSDTVEIEDSIIAANHRRGLVVEWLEGRVTLRDSKVALNDYTGLALVNAGSLLVGNIFFGNGAYGRETRVFPQISARYTRTGLHHIKEQNIHEWRRNIIMGLTAVAALVQADADAIRTDMFENTRNLYFQPQTETIVRAVREWSRPAGYEAAENELWPKGQALELPQWQERTITDLDSFFGDPQFRAPEDFDFVLLPSSPWYRQQNWPIREVQEQDAE